MIHFRALPVRAAASFGLAILSMACGASVQFDPSPAPDWVNAAPTDVQSRQLSAVGATPATLDAKRDADLALREAKKEIAQMFDSQVRAQASDWSLASMGGAADSERQVAATSVEVRSNVNVEDVTVVATHRDEPTRTHYVKIEVDRAAWTRRLDRRLDDGMEKVLGSVTQAKNALGEGRALTALEHVIAGYVAGKAVEPDVLVMDLIARDRGTRAKLNEYKAELDDIRRKVGAEHPVAVNVRGPKDAVARLVENLKEFLGQYGFNLEVGGSVGIHIDARIGQKYLKAEKVADRKEHVVAATGSLEVKDANGGAVTTLNVELGTDRFTERDTDRKTATQKALELAADTLAARFRSAFRKSYPMEE